MRPSHDGVKLVAAVFVRRILTQHVVSQRGSVVPHLLRGMSVVREQKVRGRQMRYRVHVLDNSHVGDVRETTIELRGPIRIACAGLAVGVQTRKHESVHQIKGGKGSDRATERVACDLQVPRGAPELLKKISDLGFHPNPTLIEAAVHRAIRTRKTVGLLRNKFYICDGILDVLGASNNHQAIVQMVTHNDQVVKVTINDQADFRKGTVSQGKPHDQSLRFDGAQPIAWFVHMSCLAAASS
eukprot:CAMPEP_0194484276 /NCGR_PEP_ID=MMETSP0253-20130528/5634_1 /TAXON_ID=2966 /ORGANISM="Noctiluca scintillans" /LENGTH=240 /DNA_ID=CAMNT_0039324051 /DNA_START=272 /DNA_END=995 /DNA_ORIENTATION=+